MTATEAAELLDVIAARAQTLRERGVRRLELGAGVAFTLADVEAQPAGAAAGRPAEDDLPRDALEDPETYGLHGPDQRRIPRRVRTPLVEPAR